jgi:hypothetical protein
VIFAVVAFSPFTNPVMAELNVGRLAPAVIVALLAVTVSIT